MGASRRRGASREHETEALLLRRVEHGESDLVLTLYTQRLGRISALARSARKSQKRFGGALEPFHTMHVRIDEPASGELVHLREAAIATPRLSLTLHLDRLEVAGQALGWVRLASPPRTPEPLVWREVTSLLDGLDTEGALAPRRSLAQHGLRLLAAFGWGLDLERCVRCGKSCVPGRAACVDPRLGGLVCRACGGARHRLTGGARQRLAQGTLESADVEPALTLVEETLRAHAGMH